jgi:hypothetical protein
MNRHRCNYSVWRKRVLLLSSYISYIPCNIACSVAKYYVEVRYSNYYVHDRKHLCIPEIQVSISVSAGIQVRRVLTAN